MVKTIFEMPIHNQIPATLVLEDGTVFHGRSFGSTRQVAAEIIFNTGMTGYQEVLTDPSYLGQMVVMTYPQIGNYGINELDNESPSPQVSALVVKELSSATSNWRSEIDLADYMEKHDIPGIQGIDTRALVLHLRNKGAMRAVISTTTKNIDELVAAATAIPSIDGANLVYDVTVSQPYEYKIPQKLHDLKEALAIRNEHVADNTSERYKVVAYDLGIKGNILTRLAEQQMDVTVVPAQTTAEEVLSHKPDAVFISNGPGDPAALTDVIANIQKLIGKTPLFGICLGHQVMALANGGRTYKLKFGHHGSNHPVKDLESGRVEITSQNHNYCVDADSLPASCKVTHINLNDNTVEGFKDDERGLYCVQYHPEAAPGPNDSAYLFRRFREWVADRKHR